MNHDVIVIGGSAGGVEVLLELVNELPADIPATLFVVLHSSPNYSSTLPEVLSRRGVLPVSHPLHGEKFERGRIYVAPPDAHLLVRRGYVEVVRGPRENGHRPAVDALFRSASVAYGSQVIGVVLSGHQDCGTAGMMSIKARGGIGVVQDPLTATASSMPNSAITKVAVDHIVHPLELPSLLARLAGTRAGAQTRPDEFVKQLDGIEKGSPAELVCPTCQGVLTQALPGGFEHFRCHVGHAFSLDSLVREQSEEMERALWAAVRSLEEGAALSQRLSMSSSGDMRQRFEEKQRTQLVHANTIREILLHGAMLHHADAPLDSADRDAADRDAADRDAADRDAADRDAADLNAADDPRVPDEDQDREV